MVNYRKKYPAARQYQVDIPVFRSRSYQNGSGLGSTIFKNVLPFLKKGMMKAGKKALTIGADTLADMSENNTSVKDAFKNQLKKQIPGLESINKSRPINKISTRKTTTKGRRNWRTSTKSKSGFKKITL